MTTSLPQHICQYSCSPLVVVSILSLMLSRNLCLLNMHMPSVLSTISLQGQGNPSIDSLHYLVVYNFRTLSCSIFFPTVGCGMWSSHWIQWSLLDLIHRTCRSNVRVSNEASACADLSVITLSICEFAPFKVFDTISLSCHDSVCVLLVFHASVSCVMIL